MRGSRREALAWGAGSLVLVAAAAAGGIELIAHGVLPGKSLLNGLDGACDVPSPGLEFDPVGVSVSGTFFSRVRRREVGYTIAYPPGVERTSTIPLVVVLHAYGADHANALSGMSLAQAAALRVNGRRLPPLAFVAADGGKGYWNPHPGDDPMGMVVNELIPLCQARGLGRAPQPIGTMGISMGGYGAILLAEKHPDLIAAVAAVAAVSPAIWTSYAQARAANAGAYASARAFRADDAVTHTGALHGIAVRVASGANDPFHPGVVALIDALPAGAVTDISGGCHDDAFFVSQMEPSVAFLAQHLQAGRSAPVN